MGCQAAAPSAAGYSWLLRCQGCPLAAPLLQLLLLLLLPAADHGQDNSLYRLNQILPKKQYYIFSDPHVPILTVKKTLTFGTITVWLRGEKIHVFPHEQFWKYTHHAMYSTLLEVYCMYISHLHKYNFSNYLYFPLRYIDKKNYLNEVQIYWEY